MVMDLNLIFWFIFVLVSLTAPKLCPKQFHGPHHFLGGRFVPAPVAEKYKLHLPLYPGISMCVRIGKPPKVDISAMRENYVSPELCEDQVEAGPIDQFKKWFEDAVAAGLWEPQCHDTVNFWQGWPTIITYGFA